MTGGIGSGKSTVARVLVTMALGPLFTALISRVFIGHKLPARTWGAIVVAGVGIAWMYGSQVSLGAPGVLVGSLVALLGMAIFGPSLGPFVAMVILFAFRQLCQNLVSLPPPPGVIWRDPGFPALLGTYGVSNDLFFSGHTALAVLGAIEAFHLAPPWLGWLAIAIAGLEAGVVIVLRAHYTLDVITGALAAWAAATLANVISPLIDHWLA